MLFPSARVAGLGETSPVEATRAARGLAVFGGSLLAHLTLLGALFLWSDVALGTVEYREIALNVARGHGFVLGPGEAPILSGGHVIPVDTSGGYTAWVGNTRLTDGLDDDGLAPEGREALKAALARLLDVEPSSPDVANGRIFERAWSAEGNRVLFRAAIREVSADPLASAWLAVRKLGRFWFSLMGEQNRRLAPVVIALQLMVLLPAALGAVLAIREGRMVLPLFVVVGYLVALHVAATANARYSVPVLPYTIMLGVYAIHRLADRQRA